MASDGMIYTPSFMKTGIGVQRLLGEDTHVDTQQGDLISLLLLLSKQGKYAKKDHVSRKLFSQCWEILEAL
jgi:hypothetical protein